MSASAIDVIEVRNQARRLMKIVRNHDLKRTRRYGNSPHPDQWGCDRTCIEDADPRAIALAIEVGGIIHTPDGRLAPGWMKPAR